MKPPARKRTRPGRNLSPEPPRPQSPSPTPSPWIRYWRVSEQRGLLKAMKTFSSLHGSTVDLDYAFVEKYVPCRSTAESQSVVEFLKDSVLSLASLKLKKRTLEKKLRKPIEEWTSMASTVAGPDEEPITTAFSQMLMVSSTEPRTLRYCDPPQVYRPPTDRLVGRTVPLRPMPRMQIKVERPDPNEARPVVILESPGQPTGQGPATGPSRVNGVQVMNWKVLPPRQQLSTTAGSSPARTAISFQPDTATILLSSPQLAPKTAPPVTVHDSPGSGSAAVGKTLITTPQQPSAQSPTAIATASTPKSNSSGPHASLSSSATGQTPPPTRTDPPGCPKLPLSSPAAEFHAKFGRTSKFATEDSPRVYGVKSVVDFERIYSYLSGIHQPTDDPCQLTPMESAIVLDLLMSLPEELPLLDGKKLHKHLIQVYQFLSSTAESKMAAELLKELKDGLRSPDGKRTNCRQSAARTADGVTAGDNVTAAGGDGSNLQPDGSESQGSGDQSGSSGDADEILFPALNPFVVPVRLLMRK
ncbi:snRNA-activating protein complex subunit 2 [Pseudoliparis swirei]|uniref:snRNA-activating protein complex subunit 2 n=1 Tax=Pseudoliparis swirei TaxID=2059687 RepID=UPI0024BEA76E|nr:snRNA-activating protein complex subunit 2 [Pseudoliparis swirei]